MQQQGTIVGVSLGPGDPDLITLKGLKALRNADKIYFPGSIFSDGMRTSYSEKILAHYQLDNQKCIGFYLQMNLDRAQANTIYDATAEQVLSDVQKGLSVAIVSEGDVSTYSSVSYLVKRLDNAGATLELIPGITSYGLGAALNKLPLGLQDEQITILPRAVSAAAIKEALAHSKTVVLMKIRSVMEEIALLVKEEQCTFVYCERLGTPEQFMTQEWNDIKNRNIPYFSLMIVQQ